MERGAVEVEVVAERGERLTFGDQLSDGVHLAAVGVQDDGRDAHAGASSNAK